MRKNVNAVMNDLYECVDYMRERVNRVEECLERNDITEDEANKVIRWFWYQTFNRLMDESFSRNMPMSGWRKKEE